MIRCFKLFSYKSVKFESLSVGSGIYHHSFTWQLSMGISESLHPVIGVCPSVDWPIGVVVVTDIAPPTYISSMLVGLVGV